MTRNLNLTVTAVRTASETLKLISWSDNVTLDNITRLADSGNQAGAADLIAIQPVVFDSDAELVTACRTGGGILRLISWNLQSGTGALTRLGDSSNQAGEVGLIALTVNRNVLITAVRTKEGTLKLISWLISPDGATITRLADSGNQAGEVSEISMAGSITAVRTKEGTLKLINWSISPDGATITRLADSGNQAGEATNIAISQFSPSRYVTAVRTASGSLKLIAFDVDPSGAVTRTGDSGNQAGAVSEVALVTPSSNKLVTAVRDAAGKLKVINWDMQDPVIL